MTKKAQVLVVDDDRSNINILGAMLADHYEIIVALNGEQAIQLIESNTQIDLILLDIQMPGIDGFEVCQKIKSNPELKDIPIIFITANRNEEDERKGLMLGAVDYITKPFSQPIVDLRVKNHLELKRQRDLLAHLSKHDGLTGISNRGKFDEFIQNEWQHGLRDKTCLSLILIDIDFFKKFNDCYGHTAGDECLRKVAQTIRNSLERAVDLATRYGGEEFACVLPNTDISGARHVAELIRNNICHLQIPHKESSVELFVTVSLGISSVMPDESSSPLLLIQTADKMLYKAKEQGRNSTKATRNK